MLNQRRLSNTSIKVLGPVRTPARPPPFTTPEIYKLDRFLVPSILQLAKTDVHGA